MADSKKEMQKLFSQRERYSNFGSALEAIEIYGFRGIDNLVIRIDSPITAISGLNGTGKSTIAQLGICAYKKPLTESTSYRRQYIAKYFPVSKADPQPFRDDAKVVYKYFRNSEEGTQDVTVYRSDSQWEGYKRQPERTCRYIGFSIYIPKVERMDVSIYGGEDLEISEEFSLSEIAYKSISRILNHPYDSLTTATFRRKSVSAEIGFAKKYGKKYSENNMGLGEGRVFYIVSSLESSPDQSLFVLEEPETSLHEHAQYEFAKYLIDVVIRKKHQIIITTHSRSILSALPRESRKLLYREGSMLRISNSTSTAEATGLLSLGRTQEKMVLVEDVKAKTFLIEIIRKVKPTLLKGISISYVGSDDVVGTLTKKFLEDGYNTVGVRDGDKGENIRDKLFKLPGTLPPEKEIFQSAEVKAHIMSSYQINLDEWLSLNTEHDFHDWPALLASEVSRSEEGIWEEMTRCYCQAIDISLLRSLVENIER